MRTSSNFFKNVDGQYVTVNGEWFLNLTAMISRNCTSNKTAQYVTKLDRFIERHVWWMPYFTLWTCELASEILGFYTAILLHVVDLWIGLQDYCHCNVIGLFGQATIACPFRRQHSLCYCGIRLKMLKKFSEIGRTDWTTSEPAMVVICQQSYLKFYATRLFFEYKKNSSQSNISLLYWNLKYYTSKKTPYTLIFSPTHTHIYIYKNTYGRFNVSYFLTVNPYTPNHIQSTNKEVVYKKNQGWFLFLTRQLKDQDQTSLPKIKSL